MDDQYQYALDVERWIAEIATGPTDFADLVRALPGVDPITVRQQLVRGDSSVANRVNWTVVVDSMVHGKSLPVPHPLEFDWRFSAPTLASLRESLASRRGNVALLGAPSLWMATRDAGLRTTLFDANEEIIRHVPAALRSQVVTLDLLHDDLPELVAETVIADPPWYPDATAGFLWVAAALLRMGGQAWVSVAPLGTRPGMQDERRAMLTAAHSLGFEFVSERRGALRYLSPPFERAAYRAAGILEYVHQDWRQGDLLIFERSDRPIPPRRRRTARRWAERVIRGVRIKVDQDGPEGTDPRLISIVAGDILPSVSRRDARRALARVWTSGNRVFACDAPRRLLTVIDAVGRSEDINDHTAILAAEQIRRLVAEETAEYAG